MIQGAITFVDIPTIRVRIWGKILLAEVVFADIVLLPRDWVDCFCSQTCRTEVVVPGENVSRETTAVVVKFTIEADGHGFPLYPREVLRWSYGYVDNRTRSRYSSHPVNEQFGQEKYDRIEYGSLEKRMFHASSTGISLLSRNGAQAGPSGCVAASTRTSNSDG